MKTKHKAHVDNEEKLESKDQIAYASIPRNNQGI
jgi:hypothetical protein